MTAGPVVEEERDRLRRQSGPLEEAVHRALRAEDRQPRVDPEQVARPERQDHEDEQKLLVALRHVPCEPVRKRERDHERQRRRRHRHPDRRPQRPDIGRDAEEVAVVVERPVVDDVVVDGPPEAVTDDQPERDEEEQAEEDEGGTEPRVFAEPARPRPAPGATQRQRCVCRLGRLNTRARAGRSRRRTPR